MAEPISREQAEALAARELQRRAPGAPEFTAPSTSSIPGADARAAVIVVNFQPAGWAVVAADDTAPRMILAYSPSGRFETGDQSPGAAQMVREYATGVEWLRA